MPSGTNRKVVLKYSVLSAAMHDLRSHEVITSYPLVFPGKRDPKRAISDEIDDCYPLITS